MKKNLTPPSPVISRRPSEFNMVGLATLMLTLGTVSVDAATVVQDFTYDSAEVLIDSADVGTGGTFYNVTDGSTDPTLVAQPFNAALGTLQSFTVTLAINYDGFQTNSSSGTGFSISAGGNILLNGIIINSTGNGNGNGGAPFSEVTASFPINFTQTFQTADAGVTYDPAILAAVQGLSPFDVYFAHSPSISPSAEVTSFRYEIGQGSEVTLSYDYMPIPEPGSATLGLFAGLLALARRHRHA